MKEKLRYWAAVLGCGAMLALVVGAVAWLTGRYFPLLAGAVLLLAITVVAQQHRRTRQVIGAFRAQHGSGKDLLLVYSDSVHARPYIEANWLPRWGARTVTLNRSHPWDAAQPEVVLWQSLAGARSDPPLAIVVPRRGQPLVVPLRAAFRDYKHGNPAALQAAEAALLSALEQSGTGDV